MRWCSGTYIYVPGLGAELSAGFNFFCDVSSDGLGLVLLDHWLTRGSCLYISFYILMFDELAGGIVRSWVS